MQTRVIRSIAMAKLQFILSLLALPLLFAFIAPDKDCMENYRKILGYYDKYLKSKMYMKFSTQTIEGTKEGDKLTSELWIDGNRLKYVNPFITVLQDGVNQVLITKDNKTIVIRKLDAGQDGNISQYMKKPFHPDSLKKVITSMDCSEKGSVGKLNVRFKDDYATKYMMRSIEISYDPQKKELLKGIYEIYSGTSWHKEVYEYLSFSENFAPSVLSSNVADKVYDGHKLKAEYSGYVVRDLRK